jgi:TolB-like protein
MFSGRQIAIRLAVVLLGALIAVPAHAAPQKRLAVLELRGAKIDADVLGAFADALRAGAVSGLAGQDVQVMTRENMLVLLREMGKSECSEGECEVETARNIGADFVISGAVIRMESVFVVTLKLHETKNGSLLATDSVDAPSQIEVLRQLRDGGARLVEQLKPQPAATSPEPAATSRQPEPDYESPGLATVRNHDGFYFRFSVGPAYAGDQLSTELNGKAVSGSQHGSGTGIDFAAGTTFGRLVVGGLISTTNFSSTSVSGFDATARWSHHQTYTLYAPFAAYYPDTRKGTSFGGAVGFAKMDAPAPANAQSHSSQLAIALMATAGHEFWVSEQWSIGGMLRFAYTYGQDDLSTIHSAFIGAAVLSAVYH